MIKINRPVCPNQTALDNGNYKHMDNKAALQNACFDKCMYCESKITHIYYGDVEHIQPKSKYPELEFDWNNLGFVCAKCNGVKKQKYDETTPFINPYTDDPDEHFLAIGVFIKHKRGSERAQITIDENHGIGLNRVQLLERRKERLNAVETSIDSCFRTQNQILKKNALEELRKEANNDMEYSLCIKYLLRGHEIL